MDRVKREGEVGGWEWSVWFVGSMINVVAVVRTAVIVDVVAMMDTGYRCLVGVAMEMVSTCYIAPSMRYLIIRLALCTDEWRRAPSLCSVV